MRSQHTRFLGQFSAAIAGRVVASLLQAISIALIARSEGPVLLGTFGVFMSASLAILVLMDLGMVTFLLRAAGRSNVEDVSDGLTLNRVGLLVSSALLGLAGYFVALSQSLGWWLPILAVAVSVDRAVDTCGSVLYAKERVMAVGVLFALRRVGGLVGVVTATQLDFSTLLGFAVGFVASSSACYVWLSWSLRDLRVFPATTAGLIRVANKGWPFGLNNLGSQAMSLDALILGLALPNALVGQYVAASRLIGPFLLIPQALTSLILPRASRASASSIRAAAMLAVKLFILMVIVSGLAAIFSSSILIVVMGQQFAPGATVLAVLIFGVPFMILGSVLSSLLQAASRERFVSTTTLVCSALGLFGLLVCALLGGLILAASAIVAASAARAAVFCYAIARLNPQPLS